MMAQFLLLVIENRIMKKAICILFVLMLGISVAGANDSDLKYIIYRGHGAEVAYTIRDNRIYRGCGAEVAYTIRK